MGSVASPRILLATDFDGTIAPIVARPEEASIHPVAGRFLRRCSELPEITVAILSGRDVDDVRRRIGDLRAMIAGSHGLECTDSAGEVLWTTDHKCPDLPASLVRQLLSDGLRIERKKFSMAVHYRGLEEPAADLRRVTGWADEHNLDVIAGKKVVEVRPRGGGKRAALRAIAQRVGVRTVIYAGDDITDFPALAFAASCGRAIFVESEENTAPAIPGLWRAAGAEDVCYRFACELTSSTPEVVPALAAVIPNERNGWRNPPPQ